jgi:hypothetical protein
MVRAYKNFIQGGCKNTLCIHSEYVAKILKWILTTRDGDILRGFILLRRGWKSGSFESDKDAFGLVREGEIFE